MNSPYSINKKYLKRGIQQAFYAGLTSFGLFILLIGFKTEQDINSQLFLSGRWGLLALCVIGISFARFIFVGFILPALKRYQKKKNITQSSLQKKNSMAQKLWVSLIIFSFVFPLLSIALNGLQGSLKWIDNFGIQILIYVMLGWGLNIVVGLAGLLNLGYIAFYAVGAYSYALLSTEFGLSFWIILPMAGILAAFLGILLGFPVLRLRGDYLAIVTLAFGEIIRMLLINWRELTNGAEGISGIPKASFFGLFGFDYSNSVDNAFFSGIVLQNIHYKIFLYYLILILCLLTAWITNRLRCMPIGRAWEALREDEIACRSLGINTIKTKLTAFAIGSMFAGFAGAFFGARQGFVSPESFVFMESAIILAIVVLGGMGSMLGIAFAAITMIGGTEILRELSFLKLLFGPEFTPELYRMLFFGLAMIIIMRSKPRGFFDFRIPTICLKNKGQKIIAPSQSGDL